MLKLATALVAVLLFLSPALAKNTTIKAPAPAVKQVCTPPADVLKDVGEQLLKRYDGDEAVKFATEKLTPPTSGVSGTIDTVLVLKARGARFIVIVFVDGCYRGIGVGSTREFPDLFDDGSI